MSNLINQITNLISPELINTASTFLGEDSNKVSEATKSISSSLLGSLLEKGNDATVETALQTAGHENTNIMSSLGDIFSGNISKSAMNIGGTFLNSLVGDKLGAFNGVISGSSNLSQDSSSTLLGMIAPVLAGFLGNKMNTAGGGLNGLLSSLGSEKSSFLSFIPESLTKVLGISSLAALGSKFLGGVGNVASGAVNTASNVASGAVNVAGNVASGAVNAAGNVVDGVSDFAGDAVRKTSSFAKWLMPLLLLALGAFLVFYLLRSCNKENGTTPENGTIAPITEDTSAASQNTTTDTTVKEIVKESTKIKLPNGVEINAYKGGIEDAVVNFLNSGDLKSMTEEQLKDKWFSFDNINYDFGSTTKITPESEIQVNNLVAILKAYPDAKIKIGAYTDKKGDDAGNLKVSQGRAANMKSRIDAAGVGAQLLASEGYGEQFATVAESASDAERAIDRKIALRFTK